jgi:D-alanyl-lipoteichoic acid acyltransferase DltB (MBOAT superfamily)
MSFTSLHFLAFFPIVTLLYFVVPYRTRWFLLVLASYYFYMSWRPWYALLLLFATGVSFLCGLTISAASSASRKRMYLIAGCFINLAVLFVFKYFDFFNTQTRDLAATIGIDYNIPNLDLVLPVAISFHTFQVLSYLFDVYQKKVEPERHIGIFALYVVYYPQLVAGPIERAYHFLPQLRRLRTMAPEFKFDGGRVVDGLRLILCGFVKKIVVADNLSLFVDPPFNHPGQYSGSVLLVATVGFAVQIYYDFSAYTDIARGCSRAMGIELIENFNRPYLAHSIGEFWRRWHISLTSWFRDYVYIPMGGNRVSDRRWIFNVLTVFILSGLWHGANWTFIVWGALHGVYYIVSQYTVRWRKAAVGLVRLDRIPTLHTVVQVAVTFCCVCFAWIFFRAADFSTALSIIGSMGQALVQKTSYPLGLLGLMTPIGSAGQLIGTHFFDGPRFHYTLVVIAIFGIWELRREFGQVRFSELLLWQRWTVYYAACFALLLIGNMGNKQFIYFQF